MKRFLLSLLFFPALLQAQPVDGVVKPNKQVTISSPVLQELIQQMLVEGGMR